MTKRNENLIGYKIPTEDSLGRGANTDRKVSWVVTKTHDASHPWRQQASYFKALLPPLAIILVGSE
jgi:hypothetical protein